MNPVRIAITGLAAISPLGLNVKDTWDGLCHGRCGIKPITAFDPAGFKCKLAGEVPPYRVQDYVPKFHRKAVKLMCRDIELAVVAADEAIKNSGLVTKAIDPDKVSVNPTRMAINLGAGFVSCDLVELGPAVEKSLSNGTFDIHKWGTEGMQMITPLWMLKYLPNMLACHVGIIHDIQGPSNTLTCAEAGAHLAMSEAAEIIARGDSDIALTGGVEAKINPFLIIRQCLIGRANCQENADPQTACRPFDADAKGSIFGEGAGLIVIENLEHAKTRGAAVLAELAGWGASNSLHNEYQHLEPDGTGIKIAIEKALAEAGISPEQIDLIIPHGTGIAQDDAAEARGVEAALGSAAEKIPAWPTKSMLSNTGAAAGGIDVIAAVCAIRDGLIPAAKNCDKKAAGCNLNIVKEPMKKAIRCVLCCSYTYGGQTTAVVIKKPD